MQLGWNTWFLLLRLGCQTGRIPGKQDSETIAKEINRAGSELLAESHQFQGDFGGRRRRIRYCNSPMTHLLLLDKYIYNGLPPRLLIVFVGIATK